MRTAFSPHEAKKEEENDNERGIENTEREKKQALH